MRQKNSNMNKYVSCLNPYYTGSTLWVLDCIYNENNENSLNPYYTGSTLWGQEMLAFVRERIVLILIILEVLYEKIIKIMEVIWLEKS